MGKIAVVVGPPCAGKSTFVQGAKKPNDVVVDADLLAQALGSEVAHDSTGDVREVMLNVRRVAISIVLEGIESPAWIIHTNPDAQLVRRYREAGATFKLLDPGIDECLARAKAQGRPQGTEEAIRAWYASPPDLNASKGVATPVVWLANPERERFEKWAEGQGFRLMVLRGTKQYGSEYTEAAWQAWKAAR